MAEIEDDSEETFEEKQVVVGICAMAKKSESKPMKEILTRLEDFEYIRTTIFPEETILKVSSSWLTKQGNVYEELAFFNKPVLFFFKKMKFLKHLLGYF